MRGGCVATGRLECFIENDNIWVQERGMGEIIIAAQSPIGYRGSRNNRHWGMVYRNQVFRSVAIGDKMKGYVSKITEDNRIDVSLQQAGVAQVKDSAEVLHQALLDHGGVVPLKDNRAHAAIYDQLQISP